MLQGVKEVKRFCQEAVRSTQCIPIASLMAYAFCLVTSLRWDPDFTQPNSANTELTPPPFNSSVCEYLLVVECTVCRAAACYLVFRCEMKRYLRNFPLPVCACVRPIGRRRNRFPVQHPLSSCVISCCLFLSSFVLSRCLAVLLVLRGSETWMTLMNIFPYWWSSLRGMNLGHSHKRHHMFFSIGVQALPAAPIAICLRPSNADRQGEVGAHGGARLHQGSRRGRLSGLTSLRVHWDRPT